MKEMRLLRGAHLIMWLLVGLAACAPQDRGAATRGWLRPAGGAQGGAAVSSRTEAADLLPGLPLGEGVTVGGEIRIDNLQVLPVHATRQHVVGTVVGGRDSVAEGRGVIREMGSSTYYAEVHRLILRNDDERSMLILGGTILRGGFQDRLLSGDLLVGPGEELGVEVYCAERGRWNPFRRGDDTRGRFEPLPFLAGTRIWTAGHFKGDQSGVWDQVDDTNRASRVTSMTEALLDTLDRSDFAARRDEVASRVAAHLDTLSDVVGLAYAVNGEVRSVRTFASSALFAMFRDTLSNTAANEALLARAGDGPQLQRQAGEVSAQQKVRDFVAAIRDQADRVEEITAPDGHRRRYAVARRGWGATTLVGAADPRAGARDQAEVALTTVFVARL